MKKRFNLWFLFGVMHMVFWIALAAASVGYVRECTEEVFDAWLILQVVGVVVPPFVFGYFANEKD